MLSSDVYFKQLIPLALRLPLLLSTARPLSVINASEAASIFALKAGKERLSLMRLPSQRPSAAKMTHVQRLQMLHGTALAPSRILFSLDLYVLSRKITVENILA
jgi:hypothetical protein